MGGINNRWLINQRVCISVTSPRLNHWTDVNEIWRINSLKPGEGHRLLLDTKKRYCMLTNWSKIEIIKNKLQIAESNRGSVKSSKGWHT